MVSWGCELRARAAMIAVRGEGAESARGQPRHPAPLLKHGPGGGSHGDLPGEPELPPELPPESLLEPPLEPEPPLESSVPPEGW